MLATSERVSPCRARCSPRSVGRVTTSVPSSWAIEMSRWTRSLSSPRGPATRTTSGSIETVTVAGTGMGLRPMRLMGSPDVRHDLAAHARLAGLVAGHDAARRRHDGGAHAALDLGDLGGGHVEALARARDAPQARDHALAAVGVLQRDADDLARPPGLGRLDREVVDVALLLEDAGHLALEPRRRDVDGLVRGGDRVADPREEVRDGVSHRHGVTSCSSSS